MVQEVNPKVQVVLLDEVQRRRVVHPGVQESDDGLPDLPLAAHDHRNGRGREDLALKQARRISPDFGAEQPLDLALEHSEVDGPQSRVVRGL